MELKPSQPKKEPGPVRSFFARMNDKTKRIITYALIGATLGLGASHLFKKSETSTAQVFDAEKKIEIKVDRLPSDSVYEVAVTKWFEIGVVDNSTLSGIAAQLIAKELGKPATADMFKTNLDAVMLLVKAIAKENGIPNTDLIYPGSLVKVSHKDILAAAEMVNGGPIQDTKTSMGGYADRDTSAEKPNYIWVAICAAAMAAAGGGNGKGKRQWRGRE